VKKLTKKDYSFRGGESQQHFPVLAPLLPGPTVQAQPFFLHLFPAFMLQTRALACTNPCLLPAHWLK
jgi:hypothetical protein